MKPTSSRSNFDSASLGSLKKSSAMKSFSLDDFRKGGISLDTSKMRSVMKSISLDEFCKNNVSSNIPKKSSAIKSFSLDEFRKDAVSLDTSKRNVYRQSFFDESEIKTQIHNSGMKTISLKEFHKKHSTTAKGNVDKESRNQVFSTKRRAESNSTGSPVWSPIFDDRKRRTSRQMRANAVLSIHFYYYLGNKCEFFRITLAHVESILQWRIG